jgi:2-keto-3-deoxy-L-rhamnonate aldolase RhmA
MDPEEARNAVATTKFPPQGNRSLTAALPHFQYRRVAATDVIGQVNAVGSTVFVMIETAEALGNAQEIAAVEGVDVLLLGANDLSLSMGILGGWDHPDFGKALELVAEACLRTKKVFGISGIYARPDIVKHAVEVLKARYVLGHSDMGLMAVAMKKNAEMLRGLK